MWRTAISYRLASIVFLNVHTTRPVRREDFTADKKGEMPDYQNAIWLGALVAAVLFILIIFDFLPLPP